VKTKEWIQTGGCGGVSIRCFQCNNVDLDNVQKEIEEAHGPEEEHPGQIQRPRMLIQLKDNVTLKTIEYKASSRIYIAFMEKNAKTKRENGGPAQGALGSGVISRRKEV